MRAFRGIDFFGGARNFLLDSEARPWYFCLFCKQEFLCFSVLASPRAMRLPATKSHISAISSHILASKPHILDTNYHNLASKSHKLASENQNVYTKNVYIEKCSVSKLWDLGDPPEAAGLS